MLTKPQTFEEILALWDTPKALSDELGILYVSAQMMKRRRSIGSAHWNAFIRGAAKRGIGLTLDDFARMRIKRDEVVREARKQATQSTPASAA
jgi:hypothetical protein